MLATRPQVIYEWRTRDGFLLYKMLPLAIRIRATIGESSSDVARQVAMNPAWFIFHVNLTDSSKFPVERAKLCQELSHMGISLVNAQVTDISKRKVQETCSKLGLNATIAPRNGDPHELLIIKTNCNFGGESELSLSAKERLVLGVDSHVAGTKRIAAYQILPRHAVATSLWRSEEAIVERFVTNSWNYFYRAYLFRHQLVVSRVVDTDPIKKMPIGIPRISWFVQLPEATTVVGPRQNHIPLQLITDIVEFCRDFHLEFGALDIVQDDCDNFYIVDVNTTPYWGDGGHSDLIQFLALGSTDTICRQVDTQD